MPAITVSELQTTAHWPSTLWYLSQFDLSVCVHSLIGFVLLWFWSLLARLLFEPWTDRCCTTATSFLPCPNVPVKYGYSATKQSSSYIYRPSLRILFLDFVFDSGEFFWILEIFFPIRADLPKYSWFCFRIHNGMIGRYTKCSSWYEQTIENWTKSTCGITEKPVRNPTSKFCLLIFMNVYR